MTIQKNKGSCRDCNYYLKNDNSCLIYSGFIGIDKMKTNLAYNDCEDFKPIMRCEKDD